MQRLLPNDSPPHMSQVKSFGKKVSAKILLKFFKFNALSFKYRLFLSKLWLNLLAAAAQARDKRRYFGHIAGLTPYKTQ